MAWPRRYPNPAIPEAVYPWPYAELDKWGTEAPKRPENILMTPSPDPSNAARTPTARPPPYSYQFQLPSTPVPFGDILSPTPSSSYLDPTPAKIPINVQSPRSVPHQAAGTVHSPASLYDPRCPSPWADIEVPPETPQLDKRSKEPSQSKLPCRSRRRNSKKNGSDSYGTFKCEWRGCQYDRLFSRKGVLMRHIETQHVSPRSFQCPSCDHASSRRENLKAHRHSIHKESL